MRKLMIAGAVALLGSIGVANAGEATGVITGVDASSHTITLNDGRTFAIANEKKDSDYSLADNFKPGDKVRVLYRQLNGEPTATSVTPRG